MHRERIAPFRQPSCRVTEFQFQAMGTYESARHRPAIRHRPGLRIIEPVSTPGTGGYAESQDIAGTVSCASRDVVRRFASHWSVKVRRLDDQHIALQRIENPLGRMADQCASNARSGNCAEHHNMRGLARGYAGKKLGGVTFDHLHTFLADIVTSREYEHLFPDPVQ